MKVSKKTRARRKSVKTLDDAARIACFERDGYKCVRCGKDAVILNWSHVFSRRDKRLRWELDNALTLCAGCHAFWWHTSPVEAGTWFASTYPDRLTRLRELQQIRGTITAKDLRERAEALNG